MKEHTQPILEALDKLIEQKKMMKRVALSLMTKSAMYQLDLVIFGVLKKAQSTSHAIDVLIRNRNLTCARAILRSHLETTIRFTAFWLVDKPDEMAMKFLKGTPIKKFKSSDEDKFLYDSYLAKRLSTQFPWTHRVYEQTCNYVHFGEAPFFESIESVEDDGKFTMRMNETDDSFPDESWIEVAHCASECLEIISYYLRRYEETKKLG